MTSNRHRSRLQPPMRALFWLALAVTALAALWPHASFPEPALTKGFTDLIQHTFAFFVLAILGGLGWPKLGRLALWLSLLAVLLELGQAYAPGREVHTEDLLAGLLGVGLGCTLLLLLSRWRRQRKALLSKEPV